MKIIELQGEAQLREGYAVMHELRTHLSEDQYMALLTEMVPRGYRQFAVRDDDDRIVAMAGIFFNVNLYYGHYLWVYDLITTASERSKGYGAHLLGYLEQMARDAGCDTLALASGLQRLDANRFYEHKMGMDKMSYTFKKTLK